MINNAINKNKELDGENRKIRLFSDLRNGVYCEIIIKNYNNVYVFPSGFLDYDYENRGKIVLNDDNIILKNINGKDIGVFFENIIDVEKNGNQVYLFGEEGYYDVELFFGNEGYAEMINGLLREKIY